MSIPNKEQREKEFYDLMVAKAIKERQKNISNPDYVVPEILRNNRPMPNIKPNEPNYIEDDIVVVPYEEIINQTNKDDEKLTPNQLMMIRRLRGY